MCPDEDTFTASAPSAVNATTTNTASAATTAISASSCNALAIARSNEIAIALCVAVAIIHVSLFHQCAHFSTLNCFEIINLLFNSHTLIAS